MGFKARARPVVTDPFAAWDVRQAGRRLADALARRKGEAAAEATAMTPRPGGPGFRVSIYRDSNTYPAQLSAFNVHYPQWADFDQALRAGRPEAVETGVELLSRIDPAACLDIALGLVAVQPWNLLWDCVARALARCDDETAFRCLIAHNRSYNVCLRIGASRFRGGTGFALDQLANNPAVRGSDYVRHDTMLAEGLILYLGKHADDSAWNAIVELWRSNADTHIRLACGHVMLASEQPRCLDALEASIHDGKPRGRFFGVRAVVARDQAAAVESLGGLRTLTSTAGRAVAAELLELVGQGRPMAHMADAVDALASDDAMLELALAWIDDSTTKDVAQWVIDRFPKAAVRAKTADRPKRRAPTSDDLDAMRGVMEVARQNFERIVYVLRGYDYTFASPDHLLGEPNDDNRVAVARLEAAVGPLPAALRAAYDILVSCDLRGQARNWPRDADPFVLLPASVVVDDAEDHAGDMAVYDLALSGDALAKAGFSAGRYTIAVPDEAVDPHIHAGHFAGSLIDYLRHTFEWGGFPGLSRVDEPPQLLNALRAACVPI